MRLANDRFEQFQAGLKRHQFSMRYKVGVDRQTGAACRSFQAGIVANGGGRANCSVALAMVGATSAAVDLLFSQDRRGGDRHLLARARLRLGARLWRAETLTATEIMADEIAGAARPRSIEFRLRNVLKTGHEERPGLGARRRAARRDGAGEGAHARLWTGRAPRKQAYEAANPGKYYGVGFGCIQRRFGNGAECSLAKVELAPDGRITLSHTGTEIGTGASSGQAVACARWLGRPADVLEMAVTDWPELPVETSGNPHS